MNEDEGVVARDDELDDLCDRLVDAIAATHDANQRLDRLVPGGDGTRAPSSLASCSSSGRISPDAASGLRSSSLTISVSRTVFVNWGWFGGGG
jgi:hypothetical protein